ncbi:hypothetical protein WHR41_09125 [Cladosporium halotolerans]|uniref:Uncharacterized protein n=1 Tax=Cladosporium halotolerans TaxID=1052096 RepID=A0AB34KFF1_9PEZI
MREPRDSHATDADSKQSRQSKSDLERPARSFIISSSKQSQTRRQTETQPATPISPPTVNWLTYLPPAYKTLGRSVTRRKCGFGIPATVAAVQSGLVKNERAEETGRQEDRGRLKTMVRWTLRRRGA